MGELLPEHRSRSPCKDRRFIKYLGLAPDDGGPTRSAAAGYLLATEFTQELGSAEDDDGCRQQAPWFGDSDDEAKDAFDWRAYYPPCPDVDTEKDVVVWASQSEDDDDIVRHHRSRLWRGLQGGRKQEGASIDEEVFPTAICGFGLPPQSPSPQHPLSQSAASAVRSPQHPSSQSAVSSPQHPSSQLAVRSPQHPSSQSAVSSPQNPLSQLALRSPQHPSPAICGFGLPPQSPSALRSPQHPLSQSAASAVRSPQHPSSQSAVSSPQHPSSQLGLRSPQHSSSQLVLRSPQHPLSQLAVRSPQHPSSQLAVSSPQHPLSQLAVRSPQHPSPPNFRPKPRFTLQQCAGISPLLDHISRRSSQNSQQSNQRSSPQNFKKSTQHTPQNSQQSARRSSQNSQQSARRSSQNSQQSARRSSQNSQQSARRSSQKSQPSSQHSRSSLFLRRSPLRSPPLRYRGHSPGYNESPSSKGTTLSGLNIDDLSMDEDLFSEDSYSSTLEEIIPDPHPVDGGGSTVLDVDGAAREIDQDHTYFMMCVGDVVEVEAESDSNTSDDVVTTPDSLEDCVGRVDVQTGVRPSLSEYIVWKDSMKTDTSSLLRAFTDLSVEDNTDCLEDTVTNGENLDTDYDLCAQEDSVVVDEYICENEAHVDAMVENAEQDHASVGVVELADGAICVHKDRADIGMEHADLAIGLEKRGEVTVELTNEALSVVPEDRADIGVEHADVDTYCTREHTVEDICVHEDRADVQVEHADEDTHLLDDRADIGVDHADEDTRAHEDRADVQVEHADEDTHVLDDRVDIGVEHSDEDTRAHDDRAEVQLEHADEDTIAHVNQNAVNNFCSEVDFHDGNGHVDEVPYAPEECHYGVRNVVPEKNAHDALRSQHDFQVTERVNSAEQTSSESPPEMSYCRKLPVTPTVFSSLFDESEESDDFVPGHPAVDALDDSIDLFADDLPDLPDFHQPSHTLSDQAALQQDMCYDELMYGNLPNLGCSFQDIDVGSKDEGRSDMYGRTEDLMPASAEHMSIIDSLSEIQNCNYFMRDKEVSEEEEFVVDIEAETLSRFPFYGSAEASQDEGSTDLLQGVEPHPMLEDKGQMCGNSKPLIEHAHEQSTGSCSSSPSPNRDIDALYLTQCAPLKRKAPFKREDDPATKRTRRSWEQWYHQFKTIVTTGREKLRAQNSQTATGENKENLNPFSSEAETCESINEVDSFEVQNQPTNSCIGQSCAGKSELVNYNCHEDGSDCETQSSTELLNDQLVPDQANLESTGCSLDTSFLRKSLFKWSAVEPSLNAINYHKNENERTFEQSRTPPVLQRPVRVGLSKRAHPKPLHVRRQWWVFSFIRETCSLQ